ncbi:uncharacterized protein LOC9328328 isoform X1 [Arabidopsis lyrata subsp. lyrata]|uniref:uncharacterized protein LOC9328328 isoform X1 n=1 Tax=Arabidopsis lyrata subsp. lyrata TaxID=81972 RepID=UPI000A29E594|nr:uncharacterized protein LOC9328328 isoform X1 [Arabidopsis lyrata subsp. lyrata]|eukprot:XP_020868787.1 uncharacterized protein LOC9328328 isoform X1 [Arabidopsis lyrata subsp. lyrata]
MARHAAALKIGLALLGLSMTGYILGPPLYWHLTEALAAVSTSSCPSCPCECSPYSAITIPKELSNASFAGELIVKDCAKHDPEVNEDTEKNYAELLTEELKLREAESLEKHKRADMGLLEAKKVTSSYQKEADKCNSGMETCEEAREKAELALAEQKKLTSKWEERARQKGWREGATKSNVKPKSNV